MLLLKKAFQLHEFLEKTREKSGTIGFVPTMGALHEGHLSLIRRSKKENSITTCSIYVNPTQFNDPKDLEKYPRPIEHDIEMLIAAECDVLFLPSSEEMYPEGFNNLRHYDLGHLENFLEGASRPGHFNGVANIVDRFLKIIQPDRLYLGQKDFQQVKVVEKMVRTEGYKSQIVMCDIVREPDGLAMSSRNIRLSHTQRKNAAAISRELFFIRDHWKKLSIEKLKHDAINRLNSIPETMVDYLELCNADSFTIINKWHEADYIVCVTAVKVGEVRLLDNVLVS